MRGVARSHDRTAPMVGRSDKWTGTVSQKRITPRTAEPEDENPSEEDIAEVDTPTSLIVELLVCLFYLHNN